MTHPVTFSEVLCNSMIESINVDVIASGQSYCFIDSRGSTYFIKIQPIEFSLVAKNSRKSYGVCHCSAGKYNIHSNLQLSYLQICAFRKF